MVGLVPPGNKKFKIVRKVEIKMARTKREFIESAELYDLAEQLINKYDFLHHINIGKIYFAFCTDESTKKAKPLIMGNISSELAQQVSDSKYQIAFYLDKWEDWDEEKQLIMLFKALYSISEEFDGKLRRLDPMDPYVILKTFGLDWTLRDDLPNLLVDPIHFQFPVPEAEDDDADVHGEEVETGPKLDPVIEDIVAEMKREAEAKA